MICNTDLLDEFCEDEFGHADWKMDWDASGNFIVTFFKDARPEYLADLEEDEDEDEDDAEAQRIDDASWRA